MDLWAVIAAGCIGLVGGFGICYLLYSAKNKVLADKLKYLQTENSKIQLDLDQARERLLEYNSQIVELKTRLEMEHRVNEEKLALLKKAKEDLADGFKALSAEALRKNNQSFLELAMATLDKYQLQAKNDLEKRQLAIDELVKPLKESLAKVDIKINELEQKRVGAYEGLLKQIEIMAIGQENLQRETNKLVSALKSPSVRGRWGEIQLRRVVELAGMVEYCDYYQQEQVDSGVGILRPDMIIRLPGKKIIVVDSKVPLTDYLQALEATDEIQRNEKLSGHAKQVRNHIIKLSSKSYWAQFASTPEFVVMFLPGEAFFSAALQFDPELIEFGAEKKVIIATPTTLIALLKAIAYGWNQEQINENAKQISALGKMLYDRIVILTDHLLEIRKGLTQAVQAFNKTVGSYENRVLVAARKFEELGITCDNKIKEVAGIEEGLREVSAVRSEST